MGLGWGRGTGWLAGLWPGACDAGGETTGCRWCWGGHGRALPDTALSKRCLFCTCLRRRDAKYLGNCDDGCMELARLLGWEEELQQLVQEVAAAAEAARAQQAAPASSPQAAPPADAGEKREEAAEAQGEADSTDSKEEADGK